MTASEAKVEAGETVNVTNILALRDFIRDSKLEFDMADCDADPRCGTAGCIGGHAAVLWPDIREDNGDGTFSWKEGAFRAKLGLDRELHDSLCYMGNTGYGYSRVTKPVALAVLETLAKTGEVRWDEVIEAHATPTPSA